MKKNLGLALLAATSILMAGCINNTPVGPDPTPTPTKKDQVLFWAPFGSGYTTALENLIKNFNNKQETFQVKCESQGSYKNIQTNITNSITTATYPNFALGYPDHFAGYIKSSIMLTLDDFIENYDNEHKEELAALGYESIIDDYYPQYMDENLTLKFKPDGTGYVMGLPFNKSTELLSYNGYMFDYVQAMDATIEKVPETYAEWASIGAKIRNVVISNEATSLVGKKLFGTTDADGKASEFQVEPASTEKVEGKKLLLDCEYVNDTNFKVFTWNDLDNMFITLVRQFGGVYTSYTKNDMSVYKHGFAEFWNDENKANTKQALQVIDDLHNAKIFGTASELTGGDKDTASDPFIQNKVFALVSSSGGLSYNVNGNATRVRLQEIPYNTADHKHVISQGTNMGLFDQDKPQQMLESFDAMVALSTGDLQAQWAVETGYFPATKSAMNSPIYQEFLNKDYGERNALLRAYKESYNINNDSYRAEDENLKWDLFVDPGFNGSSMIREQVGQIIGAVLQRASGSSIEDAVDPIVKVIADAGYVRS